jgi:uncharacterized protein YidB (DUF937 family)
MTSEGGLSSGGISGLSGSGSGAIGKIICDLCGAPNSASGQSSMNQRETDYLHAPGAPRQGMRPEAPGASASRKPAAGVPPSGSQGSNAQPTDGPQAGSPPIGTRDAPLAMPSGPTGAASFLDLLDRLRHAGLGDKVDSWLGDGPNQAIDPRQVASAVGDQELAGLASDAGISTKDAAAGLARALPDVVSGLTPHGEIPDQSTMALRLNRLLGE